MRTRIGCIGLLLCLALSISTAFAQENGFITPLSPDVPLQDALPDGATYEGGVVKHPIRSEAENLHLLAGFYFNNPREWRKIYEQNRAVIRNPNRLPVGETLRIAVGEGWRPKFSYQEWFRTATRNGEWKPGQPWQRAAETSAPPASSPEQPVTPTPEPAATPQEPDGDTSREAPPAEVTAPESEAQEDDDIEAPPNATPTPEEPTTEESSTEEPSTDETSEDDEDEAPAF